MRFENGEEEVVPASDVFPNLTKQIMPTIDFSELTNGNRPAEAGKCARCM